MPMVLHKMLRVQCPARRLRDQEMMLQGRELAAADLKLLLPDDSASSSLKEYRERFQAILMRSGELTSSQAGRAVALKMRQVLKNDPGRSEWEPEVAAMYGTLAGGILESPAEIRMRTETVIQEIETAESDRAGCEIMFYWVLNGAVPACHMRQ